MNALCGYTISNANGTINEKKEGKKDVFFSFPMSRNARINIKMLTCVLYYWKRDYKCENDYKIDF